MCNNNRRLLHDEQVTRRESDLQTVLRFSISHKNGMNGIDSLVVGHFGEVNEGFKQLICSLAKVAADSQEAYLALFTLIGAHSVVRFDGNELKNERKCTPRNEKNVRHTLKNGRKSTLW